jgi:hypothetical protein
LDCSGAGDLSRSRLAAARRTDGRLDIADETIAFTIVKPGETLPKDRPRRPNRWRCR